MRDLLAKKNISTFKDLLEDENSGRSPFRLQVVASDIARGQKLILPQDISIYSRKPEDLEVAFAVRMSMSLPFFFKPVKFKDGYIVDGGLLSNFPVDVFDCDGEPRWPTFGIKLVRPDEADEGIRYRIHGPVSKLKALFSTAVRAHDAYYLRSEKFVRTISVDTLDVSTTDFDLAPEQKEALYQSGVKAAKDFLLTWDFERYKALYRSGQPVPSSRERVWYGPSQPEQPEHPYVERVDHAEKE